MEQFYDILGLILAILLSPVLLVFTAVFVVIACICYILMLPYLTIRYIVEEKQ